MSTLHARLLAALDGYDAAADEAPWVTKPLAALRAAVVKHLQCPVRSCPTIQAIARELGVPEGDDHRG